MPELFHPLVAENRMSPHTPGPWRHQGAGIEAQAFDGSWRWITPVVHGGNVLHATGNRALIAAAPELLAALKDLVCQDTACQGDACKAGHAAIAKAEGK